MKKLPAFRNILIEVGFPWNVDKCDSTVNETEAETVRLIYDMYLQGNGCGTIAKRLVELGIKNKRGTVEWHDHEAIVSREIWDKAEEIRLKRAKPKLMQATGKRERYTRQFTFSSMLECGYCGHKLSRRTRHQTTTTKKAG